MVAQAYLLNARTLLQMAESVQGDAKTKAKIRFAVQQWVDAASPANFLGDTLYKWLQNSRCVIFGELIVALLVFRFLWRKTVVAHDELCKLCSAESLIPVI